MQQVTAELLERFDVPGPRYTSYPTADRFVEAYGPMHYNLCLEQRREGVGIRSAPLSVYIHIPFCDSLCYYCACNKIITKHYSKALSYLELLEREIELHANAFMSRQPVSQLHLGGGTPTFLKDQELTTLMKSLEGAFEFTPGCERSIEVDPRTVSPQRLEFLRALGFNRISFGVQDFNEGVQKAVHRIQSVHDVTELVKSSRELGFESINLDLIYGLPKQTPSSFERTLEQVIAISPDRIALYAYAHLPARFKPQRRIHEVELPSGSSKVFMLARAMQQLSEAGYVYIGMDHFAKSTDSLAVSKRRGTLHRNFQGYTVQPDGDLIGLGVSAIGRVGASYSQNAKDLESYSDLITQGKFPIVRGLTLSRDDLLRRTVIMALMCQGVLNFDDIEHSYLIDFRLYFSSELEQLEQMQNGGLVKIDDSEIQVTAKGWFFVRGVAMVFDKYLTLDENRARFSKII